MKAFGYKGQEESAYLNVLVVDPKPQSRSVLKTTLRAVKLVQSVLERASTQDLLQILQASKVHLVVIELDLGGEDVFTVVKAARQYDATQSPRFMLVAARIEADVRAKGVDAGISGFLTKPFDQRSLERTVYTTLDLPDPSQPTPAAPPAPAVNREFLDRLRKLHLFAPFTDPELVQVLKIVKLRQVGANETLFAAGDPSDKIYVLLTGAVELRQTGTGADPVVTPVKPGECFGELAIIDSEPRAASAVVTAPCMVVELPAETFHKDDDPLAMKLVRQLTVLLTQKIRRMSR
jgi:CheY-like chemotaxis protein